MRADEELRGVVTGVQVLLGFLLIVPFDAPLGGLQQLLWLVGIGATGASAVAVAMAIDRVTGTAGAVVVLALGLLAFGTLWSGLPLRRRGRLRA